MAQYFRAREAFAYVDPNGYPITISPGTVVSSDDPAYKNRESYFESVEDSVIRTSSSRAAETASAAPGERRTRTRAKSVSDEKKGDGNGE